MTKEKMNWERLLIPIIGKKVKIRLENGVHYGPSDLLDVGHKFAFLRSYVGDTTRRLEIEAVLLDDILGISYVDLEPIRIGPYR